MEKNTNHEFETFIAVVRASGNAVSKEITIPWKLCDYAGIEEGDTVKVMIKIVQKRESEKE